MDRDPELQKKLQAVQAAMERVRSGESDTEEVEVPSGGRVRLSRDQEAPTGVRVEVVGGEDGSDEGQASAGDPDPERRELMEQVKAASGRMKRGESDREELTLSGGETVRMVRDLDVPGAFTVESTREGNRFRAWSLEGPEEKPEGYPREIPFVPEVSVSISSITPADGSPAPRTVAWMNPPDVDEALESIRRQLLAWGWAEGEKSVASTLHGPTTGYAFEKAGVTRQVQVMAFGPMSQIMMLERDEE